MLVELETIFIVPFDNFVGPCFVPFTFVHISKIVVFLCGNRYPDKMLTCRPLTMDASNSMVDLSCRPLFAQRACMANTRDAPTNLMPKICMEQCALRPFYFRQLPVYRTRYDLYILSYQQYSRIPGGTKGQSTFYL